MPPPPPSQHRLGELRSVPFLPPPPQQRSHFCFTSGWGSASSQVLPNPSGVIAPFGVYCSGAAEAAVLPSSLMASGLQCDLWEGGLISFHFFSPLPQEGSSFLVFQRIRARVWKAHCGCLLKERVPSVTQISALWCCRAPSHRS